MIKSFQIECYKLIRHPLFLITLSLSFGILAILFHRLCLDYLHLAHHALNTRNIAPSLSEEIIKPLCSWSIIIMALILPVFTAYSLSQEYKQKTFIQWAMSCFKARDIVLGKWLCLIVIVLFINSIMLLMMSILHMNASLHWQVIALSTLVVLLVGSCLISFGLYISSFCKNPLIALGITYLGELLWMLLPWLNPFHQPLDIWVQHFSIINHCHHAFLGIFFSPDLIFFILTTLFWLTLTIRQVNPKLTDIPT